MRYVTLTEVWN